MIHLTLTGYGNIQDRVLCQQNVVELNCSDDAIYWHAAYCTSEQLARKDVCQLCLHVWFDSEDEKG